MLRKARPEWQDSLASRIPVYIGCAVAGDTMGAMWLTPSEIIKQVSLASNPQLLACIAHWTGSTRALASASTCARPPKDRPD
jgi:hypothetical protein